MGRICSACAHPQTEAISLEILQHVTLRDVAKKYGLSLSAVARHKSHIPAQLAVSNEAQKVGRVDNVMQRVQELDARADEIYRQASTANDPELALKALKELRSITELFSKITGEIGAKTVNNIIITPEWVSMRSMMLKALEPYPEARQALVMALGGPEKRV